MVKEVGAFSLIIFLFIILAAWWALASFRAPLPSTHSYEGGNGYAYIPNGPITIYHSANNAGSNTYSGNFSIPSCADFVTGIATSGHAPTHLHLSFTVSPSQAPCQSEAVASVPFSVSFSSDNPKQEPIVDGVEVNNTAAAFSIVEVK